MPILPKRALVMKADQLDEDGVFLSYKCKVNATTQNLVFTLRKVKLTEAFCSITFIHICICISHGH